jgi:hypothetical protein
MLNHEENLFNDVFMESLYTFFHQNGVENIKIASFQLICEYGRNDDVEYIEYNIRVYPNDIDFNNINRETPYLINISIGDHVYSDIEMKDISISGPYLKNSPEIEKLFNEQIKEKVYEVYKVLFQVTRYRNEIEYFKNYREKHNIPDRPLKYINEVTFHTTREHFNYIL